jgi:hypothetical protein
MPLVRLVHLSAATVLASTCAYLACSTQAENHPTQRECVRSESGTGCSCKESYTPNDVECSTSASPNTVCCEHGVVFAICTCEEAGCHRSDDDAFCSCGLDQHVVGDFNTSKCEQPEGGSCCLSKQGNVCRCSGDRCGGDFPTPVEACDTSRVDPCGGKEQVTKCSN